MKEINRFIDRTVNAVSNLAYLQLLWILFILAGLGVFGFFPSTVSMFTVLRQWVMGKRDIPVFRTYWQTYRSEWIRSNLLGLLLVLLGYVCYIDYRYFFVEKHVDAPLFVVMAFILILMFAVLCVYIFLVYVHFNFRILEYFKYGFLFGLSMPFKTLGILVILGFLYAPMFRFPGLLLFFGGSVPGYILMWFVHRMTDKLAATEGSKSE